MNYFIYKTTNLINHKTYIGIHQTENIDDGYIGSGLHFLRAVKKHGKENFKREILEFCSSYDELLDKERIYVNEDWVKDKTNYNLKTGGQSAGILSEESKDKISKTLKAKYASGELVPRNTAPYIATDEQKKQISDTLKTKYESGELVSKTTGVEPWNKGKTGVQIPWNKGKKGVQEGWCKGLTLGPMTDRQKVLISNSLKEYYKTNPHPTAGKEPWNKGKTLPKVECPHCGKLVDVSNGKRWHFDNCKMKDAWAASTGADRLC